MAAIPLSSPHIPWERLDRFVSQFTHDIRNDLNALELHLALLGETTESAQTRVATQHSRKILNELSRKIQTTKSLFSPIPFYFIEHHPLNTLAEVILECLANSSATIEVEENVGDFAQSYPNFVLPIADPGRIISAIQCIIDNALKFQETPEARLTFDIKISNMAQLPSNLHCASWRLQNHPSTHCLWLRFIEEKPNAESLPESNVLERWGKDPLRTTRRDGYGLGLFYVKRIVEAHKGHMEIELIKPENETNPAFLVSHLFFPLRHAD